MIELKLQFNNLIEVRQFLDSLDKGVVIEGNPIRIPIRHRKCWTQSELDYIVQMYGDATKNWKVKEIATKLMRSIPSTTQMINKLRKKGLVRYKNNLSKEVKTYLTNNYE